MTIDAPAVSAPALNLAELAHEWAEKRRASAARAADPKLGEELRHFRRQVADSFAAHLRANSSLDDVAAAATLLADLGAADADNFAAPPESLVHVNSSAPTRSGALLETTALVPAWQWTHSPRLDDVPAWLLPLYAAYRFSQPRLLTVLGQAAATARNFQRACDDLARLARANRGSAAVRAAIAAYRAAPALPPEWAGERWDEVRASQLRLEETLAGKNPADEPLALPRADRKLRLGVVASALAPTGAFGSLLPAIERLDPSRFDVTVYHAAAPRPDVLDLLQRRGLSVAPLGEQSEPALRSAMLDVVLFVTAPDDARDPIALLASQRFAPLQLAHDGLDRTAHPREIDLALAGAAAPQPLAGPRVALLPGVGPIASGDLARSDLNFDRAQLGLPEDKFVFASLVTAATPPELLETWAKLLARSGDARLVVAFAGETPPNDALLQSFATNFTAAFARHGVAEERLMIVPLALSTPSERRNFLSVANAVLATGAAYDAALAHAALEAGVPCVACSCGFDRRVTTLVQLAGLTELAASIPAGYVEAAVRLATNAELHAALQTRWQEAAPRLAALHDSFAQSEALGQLLETAFDAIVAAREQFAAAGEPLRLASADENVLLLSDARVFLESGLPAEAESRVRRAIALAPDALEPRQLLAQALVARGAMVEAADLLQTCMELSPKDPAIWHELAAVSARAGRPADALMAVETALRLDGHRVESWLLLAKLAEGNASMLADIVGLLGQLAPDDPRVVELRKRHAA